MKQLILILAFVAIFSCSKEVHESVISSVISNDVLLDGIIFDSNPYPRRFILLPTDIFLMSDSFYVYNNCTISSVLFQVYNSGGETKNVKLFIDGNLIALKETPIVNPFNILDFNYNVNVPISVGHHRMGFRGYSRGPDSLNVYFTIYYLTTLENVPIGNLPVSKKRKYYDTTNSIKF